jgi:hypothetical protein
MSTNDERPMRDVSARSAIGECDHCGGNANSTLGGEHIWKCSEVVPLAALEELVEEWEDVRDEFDGKQGDDEWGDGYNEGVAEGTESAATELRRLLE